MNWLRRLIGPATPEAARQLPAEKRFYDAGRPSRSTAGWRRPFTSARSETYVALPFLRASAHDLVRNNPHGAKIVGDLAKDLVGTGITLKADTGRKGLNKKIDALAAEFFETIDVDGITENFAAFQMLAARAFFEGGEAVFRRYIRPRRLGLPIPLQFALMEGEFVSSKNIVLTGGNRIIQGIEFSADDRSRVAYWMYKEHPGDSYLSAVEGSYTEIPVPAEDVRLMYEPQRPGQLRGTPWLTPVMVRAKLLDDYEDAERRRKSTESSIPAVVKSPNQPGEASDGQGPSLFPTMTDADGNTIEEVRAGMIAYLRDSAGIEFLKPAEAMSYSPYKRTELQSISAGARTPYELVSGDLSQTNFSSIQFGTLGYRGMHDMLRETMMLPKLKWIWRSMIQVGIATGRLPADTPSGVKEHYPPWQPIDPEKQANADKTMMRTGQKSLYEVVTARGKDFEEHVAEIAASNKLLDKYGLVFDSDPRITDLRGVNQKLALETKGSTPDPEGTESAEASTDDRAAPEPGAEPADEA